jgi:PAS domain S-box-containing protein
MSACILIVEDSETEGVALRHHLEESDFQVLEARSAEAALELLAGEHPPIDLVVTAVVMSGRSGLELCSELKRNPPTSEIPVVLLTRLAEPMDIIRGLECGADNYITKPYQPEHLVARVRRALETRRLREGTKASLGVTVSFIGRDFTITSEKEQILDLFIAGVEDVIRANEVLHRREIELAAAHRELEKHAAQQSRRAAVSTARYRNLLQNSEDAIFVLGEGGRIMDANAGATKLLGWTAEELVATSLDNMLLEDSDDWHRALDQLANLQQVHLGERRLRHAAGTETWCSLTASLTPVADDELVLLTARDVTQRKRTEKDLYESNQQLGNLVASSPLAIVAFDAGGQVQIWNPAAERTFGWDADEVLQRPVLKLISEVTEQQRVLGEKIRTGQLIDGADVTLVRKDGTPVEICLYATALRAANGDLAGAIAVLADVTERRQTELAIHQGQVADRANKAKSEFLSRMSHELRTPLNSILGFGQLLEQDVVRPEDHESVAQIMSAGRHLLTLINEVLDISKIEAGRMTLSPEPVDVRAVIRESVQLVRPLANQHHVSLHETGNGSGDFVLADRQRLKQILLNLLSNAVKYNREGGRVEIWTESIDGDRIRFLVRDNGYGIPSGLLPRLFRPFDRLGGEARGVEGTGLGLTLSKNLVEAMGGDLDLETREDAGSCFWADLPRSAHPPAPEQDAREDEEPRPTAGMARESTILIIEDQLANVRLVERLFRRRPNVRLLTAMQGRLGLELARQHRPDLILLDLNLPDLSGEKVLRSVRADPKLSGTPVVMISGDANPAQIERLRSLGARNYVTKPIILDHLLALVDEILNEGAVPVNSS